LPIESVTDFVRMTRGALAAVGFVRHEKDGVVWFEGGPLPSSAAGAPASRAGAPVVVLETVVLVHGVNDQAGTWFTVAPALARTHRVILPDLAGHGESDPKDGPLPFPLLLEKLDVVIGDARDVTLAGNSLGGWLAMLYTLEHPDRVKHLILEASGGLDRPFASPLVAGDREEAVTILRAVHGPKYVAQDWVIDSLLARAIDSPMLRLTGAADHFVDPRLHELDVPTTLIWGADDGVLPLSYAEALHGAIRGATLHVLEDAAHIPHLQQPERYLACLTATF
jgi:pimeloyl-ACP methyl ester carboxylesterase